MSRSVVPTDTAASDVVTTASRLRRNDKHRAVSKRLRARRAQHKRVMDLAMQAAYSGSAYDDGRVCSAVLPGTQTHVLTYDQVMLTLAPDGMDDFLDGYGDCVSRHILGGMAGPEVMENSYFLPPTLVRLADGTHYMQHGEPVVSMRALWQLANMADNYTNSLMTTTPVQTRHPRTNE